MLAWQIQAGGCRIFRRKISDRKMWLYKNTGPPPEIPEAWDAGKWNAGAKHVSAFADGSYSVCLDDSAVEGHEMEASGTVPEILYEDADVIAVWKPAGEVVHPSHGHYQDTLANRCSPIFRAGRACDDSKHWPVGCSTAGILFLQRTSLRTAALGGARERAVSQNLCGLVRRRFCRRRHIGEEQSICAPIGAMAGELQKMCVTDSGRPAKTYYQVRIQRDTEAFLILRLDTGRARIRFGHIWRGPGIRFLGDPRGKWDTGKDKGRSDSMEAEFCQPMTGIALLY